MWQPAPNSDVLRERFDAVKTRVTMGNPSFEIWTHGGKLFLDVMGWDSALSRDGRSPVGHLVAIPIDDVSVPNLLAATSDVAGKLCAWADQFKSS